MNKTLPLYKLFFFFNSALFFTNDSYAQPVCAGCMIPNTTTVTLVKRNIEISWNQAHIHQNTNTVLVTLPAGFVSTQCKALYDNTYLNVMAGVNNHFVLNVNQGKRRDDDAVELYIDGDNVPIVTGSTDFINAI